MSDGADGEGIAEMTSREEVEEMAEVAFQRGESDRLIWIVMEIALDIRDLLQQPAQHCPDCCYVTHGGHPSDERVRLQR